MDHGGEILGFGAAGGITSVLQGGKFGHGFVAAGLGAAAGGLKFAGNPGLVACETSIRSYCWWNCY